jgi:hypothetical protein
VLDDFRDYGGYQPIVVGGFEVDVDAERLIGGFQGLAQGGYVFAGANIELLQFFESRVSDKPCAIGGAIDACVVEDDGVAVAGKAYVDLDAVGADLGGGAEGAQGVFGAFNMMAPVSEDLQSHLLVRRELIAPGFAFEHGLAVLAHDFDLELAYRFALVDAHSCSVSDSS